MMKRNMAPSVVLGDLNLIRCLGRVGVPVTAALPELPNPAQYSRYCERVVPIPDGQDQPEAVARALMALPWPKETHPSLFYQGDHDLLVVSRYRDLLAEKYRFLVPPADLVEDLVDKSRFLQLSLRLGLPLPRTRIVEPGPEMGQVLDAWDSFPCIIKPALRTHWFDSSLSETTQGPQKAILLADRAALEPLREPLARHHTALIFQEWIPGGEEQILSYHAYVRPDGEYVAGFTGRKIRTYPRDMGMSCYVEVTDDPRVHCLGREIMARLGFYGTLKIDFKEDPRDGRLYMLEINPRFNLWDYPAAVAGANIPALVYRDLNGLDWPLSTTARPGMRWLSLYKDIRAFRGYHRAGELGLAGWLRSLCAPSVYDAFAWEDPVPGAAAFWQQCGKLARRWRH